MADKESQKLYEDVEESIFAILMDEFAVLEGEWLLTENKRLAIKPVDLPADIDDRIKRAIDRQYKNFRWKKINDAGKRIMSRVAMFVLVISMLFSLLCVSSSAFRKKVLNLVTEWTEKYTRFQITEEAEPKGSIPHEPYWVPEGYELIERIQDSYKYENAGDGEIILQIISGSSTGTVDTEGISNVNKISICGFSGIAFAKKNSNQISFGDTDSGCLVYIISNTVTIDELVRMAESLYFLKN